MFRQLKELKKGAALVNFFIVKPKAAGKGKGKPDAKGAKKSSARRFKAKGKDKNPKGKPNKGASIKQLPLARRRMTRLCPSPSPKSHVSLI